MYRGERWLECGKGKSESKGKSKSKGDRRIEKALYTYLRLQLSHLVLEGLPQSRHLRSGHLYVSILILNSLIGCTQLRGLTVVGLL